MKESSVEKHLHDEVVKHGGWTYKFASPGRRNVPDRIVIWRGVWPGQGYYATRIHLVELKAPGKKLHSGQGREHVRLMKLGVVVLVLDTKAKVDTYVGRHAPPAEKKVMKLGVVVLVPDTKAKVDTYAGRHAPLAEKKVRKVKRPLPWMEWGV